MSETVPALVVSGFLGSGKTTLVRRILDDAQDRGVRVYCDCAIEGKWDKLKDPPAPLPITEADHPDHYFQVLGSATRRILNSTADGIYYYEAGDNGPRTWNTIRKAAGR